MSANSDNDEPNSRQLFFREMVLGTLVYCVVLGFFNDYTDILKTDSYSVTFLVAVVLQVLTYVTLLVKNKIANVFKSRTGKFAKIGLAVGVWLVLFLSKFVFLAVIDFVFGPAVQISGFVGLMIVIIIMTLSKELIDFTYKKLGD